MNNYAIAACAVAWIACGVADCGFIFAHFQRKFQWQRRSDFSADRRFAAPRLVLGPLSLISTLLLGFCDYGWLWPWSQQARREARLDAA